MLRGPSRFSVNGGGTGTTSRAMSATMALMTCAGQDVFGLAGVPLQR
jgi:hypothetical protein